MVSPDAMPGSSSPCCSGVPAFMIASAASTTVEKYGAHEQHAAHLLEHDAELDEREALAAVLLGDVEALEAELVGHLAPHRGVVALGGLHETPHLGRRRLRLEEATDGVAQLVLLVGEGEVHDWGPRCAQWSDAAANATGPHDRRARPGVSRNRPRVTWSHAAPRALRDPDRADRQAHRRAVREQRVRRALQGHRRGRHHRRRQRARAPARGEPGHRRAPGAHHPRPLGPHPGGRGGAQRRHRRRDRAATTPRCSLRTTS